MQSGGSLRELLSHVETESCCFLIARLGAAADSYRKSLAENASPALLAENPPRTGSWRKWVLFPPLSRDTQEMQNIES